MGELCDRFLQAKDDAVDAGDITQRTRDDYETTCDKVVDQFGKSRLVSDLASDNFQALRATVAKIGGPVHLGNIIQRVRVIFKFAYDAGLIDRPVRYGPTFKKPSKKVLRLERAEKGSKMLEAADLGLLIEAADVQMKAMILLGLNCGFGNSDCGTLPLNDLDLDGGWHNYHRPKTGIKRRCRLWPETVESLKAAIAKRPTPKTPEAEPLVFVTKCGAPWAKETVDNPVTKEFRKLLDDLGLHKAGLGFYALRHVFRTIADESRDQPAIDSIMGHADESMAATHRERIADDRLKAVTNYVHGWLYPVSPSKSDQPAKVTSKRASAKAGAGKALRKRQRRVADPAANGHLLRIVG